MDKNTFIRIKTSAVNNPPFRDLSGLVESGKTSELIDFVTLLHPGADKVSQGSRSTVRTSRGTYHYTIYNNCILKTWRVDNDNTIKKTLFKL